MKVNPKFLALCLMVLFSINLMTAQTSDKQRRFKNSEKRAEKHIEKLTTELTLSETQVGQLTEIETAYAAKMKAAKDATTNRADARATIKTLRDEKDAAVKGILNPTQTEKYAAIKAERKGKKGAKGRKGKKGRGGKNAGTPEERAEHQTTRLAEKLNLSDAQTTEVAAINLSYVKKIKATKDATEEKGANKAAIESLRTAHKTAIKAVLTPEQLTAFEAMKGSRKGKGGKGRRGRK